MKNDKIFTTIFSNTYNIKIIKDRMKRLGIKFNITDKGREIIIGKDVRDIIRNEFVNVYGYISKS
jgi:hypothetical protein